MHAFAIIRLAIFGTILLFSLISLAISGNFVSKTSGWSFPGFALAVALLTMIIAIPMLVIDMVRKGAVVSWVAVELGWTGLLWVLWLASAALSTSTLLFTGDCSVWFPEIESLCRQYSALQAFQWLTWLLLFAYIVLVIILAVMATVKGNKRAWLSPTSDLSFSPTHSASTEPKIPPPGMQGYPGGQPGQPGQYTGSYPGSPAAAGQYQSPMTTGGYQAPAPTGYNQFAPQPQPGQYGTAYGQPAPNVAQV